MKAWKARNRRHFVDMAEAGMSATAIEAAWRELSERRGYPVQRLDWVQEAAGRPKRDGDGLVEWGGGLRLLPSPADDIPTDLELVAAGVFEPYHGPSPA